VQSNFRPAVLELLCAMSWMSRASGGDFDEAILIGQEVHDAGMLSLKPLGNKFTAYAHMVIICVLPSTVS